MGWDKRWERPLYLLMYLQEWIDLDILPLNAYYLYTMLMRMQCRDFLVTSDNVLYDVAYQRIRHSKGGSHISVNIAFLSHKIIKCYQYCRESTVILLMDTYADEDWRLVKAFYFPRWLQTWCINLHDQNSMNNIKFECIQSANFLGSSRVQATKFTVNCDTTVLLCTVCLHKYVP